jgi:hypothetical protein
VLGRARARRERRSSTGREADERFAVFPSAPRLGTEGGEVERVSGSWGTSRRSRLGSRMPKLLGSAPGAARGDVGRGVRRRASLCRVRLAPARPHRSPRRGWLRHRGPLTWARLPPGTGNPPGTLDASWGTVSASARVSRESIRNQVRVHRWPATDRR